MKWYRTAYGKSRRREPSSWSYNRQWSRRRRTKWWETSLNKRSGFDPSEYNPYLLEELSVYRSEMLVWFSLVVVCTKPFRTFVLYKLRFCKWECPSAVTCSNEFCFLQSFFRLKFSLLLGFKSFLQWSIGSLYYLSSFQSHHKRTFNLLEKQKNAWFLN